SEMLTAPRRTARPPNSTRMSFFPVSGVRLHSTLNQFNHRDALVEGKSADALMELGEHLEIELQPLGRRLFGPVRNQSPIGYCKWPGLPRPPAGRGSR